MILINIIGHNITGTNLQGQKYLVKTNNIYFRVSVYINSWPYGDKFLREIYVNYVSQVQVA